MNKVWFITGCSTGFGRFLAIEALEKGYKVVVTARNTNDVQDIVAPYPETAIVVKLDVTDAASIKSSVAAAIEKFGQIDGFFSYAGITPAQSLLECTEEMHDNIFNVNLKGPLFCSKYAIQYMKMNKSGGSIIFTGSPHSDAGEIDRVSYACSKGAIVTLANHIAKNYGKYNIRSNYITMGWTPTEGELSLRESQGMSKDDLEIYASKFIPMGRMSKIEDIVPAILYLLSNNSKMVSGSNIRITGGWFM
jgi:NAD(P)-dependent dehydrogenase (short-subunit alcohol dehydrogenase family)